MGPLLCTLKFTLPQLVSVGIMQMEDSVVSDL